MPGNKRWANAKERRQWIRANKEEWEAEQRAQRILKRRQARDEKRLLREHKDQHYGDW